MWYVKDEFSSKIYFKHEDVDRTQNFATHYNSTYKFAGQRMFKFNLYTFTAFMFDNDCIDVSKYTGHYRFLSLQKDYKHPLAIKGFDKKHKRYLENKINKCKKLAKKYHLWSYNEKGRKCDGFDF